MSKYTIFKNRGVFDLYEWNGTPAYATPLTPTTPPQTHRFDARQDEDWKDKTFSYKR